MKTIVVWAIFVLELVSSFPYPDPIPVPTYFETYEPQQIHLPTLAHSPDLYQQQLYIQQQSDNIRRQNYENLLRNQDLNQRLASQMLTRPSYNIQPVLNTVREPYINSIPLQRPIQRAQYEAPLTQQYYPVQRQQPIRQYQPVQNQYQVETTEAHAEAENAQGASQQINQYPQAPQQQYLQYNAQQLAYHPRIRQVLASTPLKKRYLVLHPNGTIEHIDKIEHIVEQHPNYILVNAGSVDPQQPVPRAPVAPYGPVAPIAPAAPNAQVSPNGQATPNAPAASNASAAPNAQVAPNAAKAPNAPASPLAVAPASSVASAPVDQAPAPVNPAPEPATGPVPLNPTSINRQPPLPPTIQNGTVPGAKPANLPTGPTAKLPPVPAPIAQPLVILNGTVPGPKPTVPPPTGPTTVLSPGTAQPAQPPVILNGTVPGPKPTVPPPTGPTTVLPSVTAPTAQSPIILNGTVPGPKPTSLPPTGPTTVFPPVTAPTAQPPVILNGTIPGPNSTVPTPTGPTTELPPTTLTAQPPIWVKATATAKYPPTTPLPATEKSTTAEPTTPVTPIPPVTTTATATATEGVTAPSNEDPTVAPYILPSDPTDLDVLQVNGAKPVVWFRTDDLDFWKKLTQGDETFDVLYFFNIPREPRVMKETNTTFHADGTVVEEVTETIYDDEDSPPRVIKTTTVTKPDGTHSKTSKTISDSNKF